MTAKEARETYESMSDKVKSDIAEIMMIWLNSSPERQAEIFDLVQKLSGAPKQTEENER